MNIEAETCRRGEHSKVGKTHVDRRSWSEHCLRGEHTRAFPRTGDRRSFRRVMSSRSVYALIRRCAGTRLGVS